MDDDKARPAPAAHDAESDSDSLDSLMADAPVGTVGSAGSGDDDKIDLQALIKLSSMAPRAPSDAPPASRASHALPELHESVGSPASLSMPPRASRAFVLPLLLGFALGVPAGAWFFSGKTSSEPAVAPEAAAAIVVAAAPPNAPVAPVAPREAAPALAHVELAAAHVNPPAPAGAPRQPSAATPALTHASQAQPTRVAAQQPSAAHVALVAAPTRELAAQPAEAPVVVVQKVAPVADAVDPLTDTHSVASAAPAASPKTVDNMLDEALAAPSQRRAALPAADDPGALPLTPSRDEVSGAMAVLLPAIRGCAMGQAGLATAGIVVQNDGRVASVNVAGAPFAGSASGRCMEGVVRRARFPRFKQPSFRVQFPFAIQ